MGGATLSDSDCFYRVDRVCLDVADVQIFRSLAGGDDEGSGAPSEQELLLAIERKTGHDFAASVRDGRYHEQKRRLTDFAGPDRVAYVLEGRMSQTRRFSDWENARVRGCLLSLHLKHRTPVLCTLDVVDTAALVLAACKQVAKRDKKETKPTTDPSTTTTTYETLAVRASAACKRRNVDARMCFLQQLCQIPGVSSTIANQIADASGGATCMRQLLGYLDSQPDATAALTAIPMVGKKKAASILDMLCGARA